MNLAKLTPLGTVIAPPEGTSPGRVALVVERTGDVNSFEEGDLVPITITCTDFEFNPIDPTSIELVWQTATSSGSVSYSGADEPSQNEQHSAKGGANRIVARNPKRDYCSKRNHPDSSEGTEASQIASSKSTCKLIKPLYSQFP